MMTRKEMTELFALMMLAWPKAEMFKGGKEKLAPTIELWTVSTSDIDYWTGQRAVMRLCQNNVYPPAIAEFREAADAVRKELDEQADEVLSMYWMLVGAYGQTEKTYSKLPAGSVAKETVDALGGPDTNRTLQEQELHDTCVEIIKRRSPPLNVRQLEGGHDKT